MAKRQQIQQTAAQIQENVLSTFAYHSSEIMTSEHLCGFGITSGDVSAFCTMKVVVRAEEGAVSVWDTIEVDGVVVGNRCAAREAYAKLCAPVIAAAFAAK